MTPQRDRLQDASLSQLSGIHLWHANISSCSQRVRIALAEKDLGFTSRLIDLQKGENATTAYQTIHPKGLVPAMVIDGELIIESVDIIHELDRRYDPGMLSLGDSKEITALTQRADSSQTALKLMTFEFLFREAPPPSQDSQIMFQQNHNNESLKEFHRDFAAGFERSRIESAANESHKHFRFLDSHLSHGQDFLVGNNITLADIAWMPNFHRFDLIEWPFDDYTYLRAWANRVSERPSYQKGLIDWEPKELLALVGDGIRKRVRSGEGAGSYITES